MFSFFAVVEFSKVICSRSKCLQESSWLPTQHQPLFSSCPALVLWPCWPTSCPPRVCCCPLTTPVSSSCPAPVLLLKETTPDALATVSGRAGEPFPDVPLFSSRRSLFGPVLPMFFYCLLVVLQEFIGCGWQPFSGVLLPSSSWFLLSPRPFLLLFSVLLLATSWCAPLMLSCCAFGVVRSQLGLLLSLVCSHCFPSFILLSSVVLLMSSFGLSVVLLFTSLSKAGAEAAAVWGLCWYDLFEFHDCSIAQSCRRSHLKMLPKTRRQITRQASWCHGRVTSFGCLEIRIRNWQAATNENDFPVRVSAAFLDAR